MKRLDPEFWYKNFNWTLRQKEKRTQKIETMSYATSSTSEAVLRGSPSVKRSL